MIRPVLLSQFTQVSDLWTLRNLDIDSIESDNLARRSVNITQMATSEKCAAAAASRAVYKIHFHLAPQVITFKLLIYIYIYI